MSISSLEREELGKGQGPLAGGEEGSARRLGSRGTGAGSLQRCLLGRAKDGFLARRGAVFLGKVTIVKRTEDVLVLGGDGFGLREELRPGKKTLLV